MKPGCGVCFQIYMYIICVPYMFNDFGLEMEACFLLCKKTDFCSCANTDYFLKNLSVSHLYLSEPVIKLKLGLSNFFEIWLQRFNVRYSGTYEPKLQDGCTSSSAMFLNISHPRETIAALMQNLKRGLAAHSTVIHKLSPILPLWLFEFKKYPRIQYATNIIPWSPNIWFYLFYFLLNI